ncbi:MAG: hypothetical protein NUV94_07755 [Candidatus Acetothermia bacterium]|nr:hypothetical protein [Candidatus Acetothermia bacterium]
MNRCSRKQWAQGMAFLLCLLAALSGCAPRKSDPIRSGWSRGLPVAETEVGEAPTLAIAPTGRWLVWTGQADGDTTFFLSRVDPMGHVTAPSPIPLALDYPHAPRLFATPNGFSLFFLARTAPGRYRIFVQPLDAHGAPTGAAIPVSPAEQGVDAYAVGTTLTGFMLVWNAVDAGEWAQALDEEGIPLGPPLHLAERGGAPALAVDGDGWTHVIWLSTPGYERRELMYAKLSADAALAMPPCPLWGGNVSLGAVFSAPTVALDTRWLYALVSVEYRSGLKQGATETHVVAAPLAAPDRAEPFLLSLPEEFPEEYPYSWEGLPLVPLPPQGAHRATDTHTPVAFPGQRDHALVAVGVKVSDGRRSEVQPAVVALKDGAIVGWCPLANTTGWSISPQLRPSPDGWHAVWSDMHGYGAYRIYYATTAPAERAVLNRVEMADVLHMLLTVLSGFVSGLTMIPLFLMAAVPGLLLVVGHYVFGGEGDLHTWTARILLVLGLSPYVLLKILFTAGLVPTMPFAAWFSSGLARSLALSLPFGLLLVDGGALALYWRRSQEPGLLPAWALFVGVDIALTLLVVGPLIAGA